MTESFYGPLYLGLHSEEPEAGPPLPVPGITDRLGDFTTIGFSYDGVFFKREEDGTYTNLGRVDIHIDVTSGRSWFEPAEDLPEDDG